MKNLLDLAAITLLAAAHMLAPAQAAPVSDADILSAPLGLSTSPTANATITGESSDLRSAPSVAIAHELSGASQSGGLVQPADGGLGWHSAFGADSDNTDPCFPDNLAPIYFDFDPCPDLIGIVNFSKCTYYIRVFYDCDGDGLCDGMDGYFVPGITDGGPWHWFHEPDPGCEIIGWGIFDVLPWGKCKPLVLQDDCWNYIF